MAIGNFSGKPIKKDKFLVEEGKETNDFLILKFNEDGVDIGREIDFSFSMFPDKEGLDIVKKYLLSIEVLETRKLLVYIQGVRKCLLEIEDLFHGRNFGLFMNKVATDLLCEVFGGAFNAIENRLLEILRYAAIKKTNPSDLSSPLSGLVFLTNTLSNLFQGEFHEDVKSAELEEGKAEYMHSFSWVDLENKRNYKLKIFIRPEFLSQKRRGGDFFAEARIGIELELPENDPLHDSFMNTTSYKDGKSKGKSAIRMSFDMDRHQNHLEGDFTLDLGRGERTDDSFSRTGDSLGRLLGITNPGREGHSQKEFETSSVNSSANYKIAAEAFNIFIAYMLRSGDDRYIQKKLSELDNLVLSLRNPN